MKPLAAIVLLALSGCTGIQTGFSKVTLQAHAYAVADVASENDRYVDADAVLTPTQRAIRHQRNLDTKAFAAKLAEVAK